MPRPLVKPTRDLSTSGFSVEIDAEHDLLPLGMQVSHVSLTLGAEQISARGAVRNLARLPTNGGLRVDVEFLDLDESARMRLADFIMQGRFPPVVDGQDLGFDQLWAFLRETRFLFPEKIAGLEPLMKGVRHTLDLLHSHRSRIFKSVVCRDGSRLLGHISGLRAYRDTWMMQHLAALPGRQVGRLLMMGALEYVRQNPDLRYVKAWYFPQSRWPARMFGGFARTIANSELSELRSFLPFTVPVAWPLPPAPGIEVIEASRGDLPAVESYFVGTERGLLLRADDLLRSAINLSELNSSFRKVGLQRRRRVLLALRRDVPLGFALAEVSSPGLNLSEVLSSFRVFILPNGRDSASEVRSALIIAVLPIYRQAGRLQAVGVMVSEDAAGYAELGIRPAQPWMCWTFDSRLVPAFCEHVDRMFDAVSARRSRAESSPSVRC
jgi:hypothetical protein